MKSSTPWKRNGHHRWRPAAVAGAALTFVLLTVCTWWSPVDERLALDPRPAVTSDVEALRRLLLRAADDKRGSWSCRSNASDCVLTPSLLAATSTARRSVHSRTGLDCLAMFRGNSTEIEAARRLTEETVHESGASDVDLEALASDCAAFKRSRGYFTQPLSGEEAEFPIAFSILAYDNIPQVWT